MTSNATHVNNSDLARMLTSTSQAEVERAYRIIAERARTQGYVHSGGNHVHAPIYDMQRALDSFPPELERSGNPYQCDLCGYDGCHSPQGLANHKRGSKCVAPAQRATELLAQATPAPAPATPAPAPAVASGPLPALGDNPSPEEIATIAQLLAPRLNAQRAFIDGNCVFIQFSGPQPKSVTKYLHDYGFRFNGVRWIRQAKAYNRPRGVKNLV